MKTHVRRVRGGARSAKGPSRRGLPSQPASCVVKISGAPTAGARAPSCFGSGVVVGPRHVITCWHVAERKERDAWGQTRGCDEPWPALRLELVGRRSVPLVFVGRDAKLDIALLRSTRDLDVPPAEWLDDDALESWFQARAPWAAVGYSEAVQGIAEHRGWTSLGKNPEYVQLQSGIPAGFSGGALRADGGPCVGLVQLGGKQAGASTALIVPRIDEFLARQEQPPLPRISWRAPNAEATALRDACGRWRSDLQTERWRTLTPAFMFGRSLSLDECFADLHFVPLSGLSGAENGALGGTEASVPDAELPQTLRERRAISIDSVLASPKPRTVIVGAPGAGKTTFLRWLAQQVTLGRAPPFDVPVLVPLSAFARFQSVHPQTSLAAFFFVHQLGMSMADAEPIAHELMRGAAFADQGSRGAGSGIFPLFLLDGWDEVPQALRPDVLDAIRAGTSRFFTVITSRPSGVPRVFQENWASLYELGSLSPATVREQIFRICGAVERPHESAPLLRRLDDDPALLDLCSNPFMLTVLCAVLLRDRAPARQARITRAWLMSEALAVIDEEREARTAKARVGPDGHRALATLAHEMSFGPAGKRVDFDKGSLERVLASGERLDAVMQSRLVDALDSSAVSYRFSHLRIQEYLAARHIHDEKRRPYEVGWETALSIAWQEEMKFLAALSAHDPEHPLWRQMKEVLAQHSDPHGVIPVRLARLLAAAGCDDGGNRLLGVDLRPMLWKVVPRWREVGTEALRALCELDEDYVGARLKKEAPVLFTQIPVLADYLPYRLVMRFGLQAYVRVHRHELLGVQPIESRPVLSDNGLSECKRVLLSAHAPRAVKLDAILSLGASRDQDAVPILIQRLGDSDPEVFFACCQALMTIGGRRSAAALVESLLAAVRARRYRRARTAASALQPDNLGRGILDPPSRDRLLRELGGFPRRGAGLACLLTALEGALIPSAGDAIIAAIESSHFPTEQAAVKVLPGLLENGAMVRALDLALAADNLRRGSILGAVPVVPPSYPRADDLARLAFSPGDDEIHTGRLIDLFARTIRLWPRHPLLEPARRGFAAVVARWSGRMKESLRLACIDSVDVLGEARQTGDMLRRSVSDYEDGEDGETLAYSAVLALWRVEGAGATAFLTEYLFSRLARWADDFVSAQGLFHVIVNGLVTHAPAASLVLLRRLKAMSAAKPGSGLEEMRERTIGQAALRGLILFDDHVLDQSGHPTFP